MSLLTTIFDIKISNATFLLWFCVAYGCMNFQPESYLKLLNQSTIEVGRVFLMWI